MIVLGEVNGNIAASEKVDIRDGGSVDGDIVSPKVAIAEGAHFRGSVDMQRKGGQALAGAKPSESAKPADSSKSAVAAQPVVAQAAQPAAH